MLEFFHFIRPLWLLALPIGIITITLFWHRISDSLAWQHACDAHLLPYLIEKQTARSRSGQVVALVLWILGCMALAGPSWEKLQLPLASSMQGRVFVLDLSRSMDSNDIKPSRLTRARYKLIDLVKVGRAVQQGLVVFAADAFVVSPLTDDVVTLINLIPALSTDTVPVQGGRADLGLELGARLIDQAGLNRADIVLITDDYNDAALNSAKSLLKQGIKVSVLAVGTKTGAPIPTTDGGLLKDRFGQIVIAGVDTKALKGISDAANGRFTSLTADDSDIKLLTDPISTSSIPGFSMHYENHELTADYWLDRGSWLLLPMLLLTVLSFRRGWILCLPIIISTLPQPAEAFDWRQLWKRSDQIAAEDFFDGNYDQTAASEQLEWQAVSRYRLGDYEGALNNYRSLTEDNAQDAESQYNMGNTLARSGRLQEAIASYEQVLRLSPDMDDAQFNKELIEKMLQQQEQQTNDKQDQQNENDQQNNKADNNDSSEDSNQQGKEGDTEQQYGKAQNSNRQPMENNSNAKQSETGKMDESKESNKLSDNESSTPSQNISKDKDGSSIAADRDESNEDPQIEDEQNKADRNDIDSIDKSQMSADKMNELENELNSEQKQVLTQWLRKIPDDPGGLLRRKFSLQHQQRMQKNQDRLHNNQSNLKPW